MEGLLIIKNKSIIIGIKIKGVDSNGTKTGNIDL